MKNVSTGVLPLPAPFGPELEQRLERGIPSAPRHEPGLPGAERGDRFRQGRRPRIIHRLRRGEHQGRGADLLHVHEIASVRAERRCPAPGRPQQRRADRLQVWPAASRRVRRSPSRRTPATTPRKRCADGSSRRVRSSAEVLVCRREIAKPRCDSSDRCPCELFTTTTPFCAPRAKRSRNSTRHSRAWRRHDRHHARRRGHRARGAADRARPPALRRRPARVGRGLHLGAGRRPTAARSFHAARDRQPGGQVVAPGTPTAAAEEGCLSFPKIRGDVPRPDAIKRDFSG
jgi:hypothetical protein